MAALRECFDMNVKTGMGGDELQQYFTKLYHGSAYVNNASHYIMKLTHLRILFNTSMLDSNVHQLGDKLRSFISKLELWQRKMKCEILGIFPSLKQFINSDNKCEKLIS
jgi:hypothetical protein